MIDALEELLTGNPILLEYHPLNHLGIGLGFNAFRFSMTATEEWKALNNKSIIMIRQESQS